LINTSADLNVVDNWNRMPISYLAQFDGVDIGRLLYEHGRHALDLAIADVGGFTPIMTAIESNSHNMLGFLLGIVHRDVLAKTNAKGETALHLVMRCANEEILSVLSRYDLDQFSSEDLDCIDAQGFTVEVAKAHRWDGESSESLIADRIIEKIRSPDQLLEKDFYDAWEQA
jgi:hypothetical protein